MNRADLKVVQSAVRCPWCHEDVVIASDDWVACRECMARHHDTCWEERARCATCGGAARLGGAVVQVASVEVERLRIEAELARLERDFEVEVRTLHRKPGEAPGTSRGMRRSACALFAIGALLAVPALLGFKIPLALGAIFGGIGLTLLIEAEAVQSYEQAYATFPARKLPCLS